MQNASHKSKILGQKDRSQHGSGQAGYPNIAKKGLESPENLGRLRGEGFNSHSNPQSPVLK